ncbi:MAG: DUF5684 domain-containing protein [Eubacterium sp.]|nr:DUF5684 domain-containing protein [Eubacterium sp.]
MINFLPILFDSASSADVDALMEQMTASLGAGYYITSIIVAIVEIVALWKIFEKAGVPGWHSIIPLLNSYDLTKIATGNGWLFLLCLIPCVGSLIWLILIAIKLSAAFGCGGGMIALLILVPVVGYLVLAFGSAQYQGPQ